MGNLVNRTLYLTDVTEKSVASKPTQKVMRISYHPEKSPAARTLTSPKVVPPQVSAILWYFIEVAIDKLTYFDALQTQL